HPSRRPLGPYTTLFRSLDQLRTMTVVVADTGDIGAIEKLKPVDCTTNPSLLLKAAGMEGLAPIVDEAVAWGKKQGGETEDIVQADRKSTRLNSSHVEIS